MVRQAYLTGKRSHAAAFHRPAGSRPARVERAECQNPLTPACPIKRRDVDHQTRPSEVDVEERIRTGSSGLSTT
jgi:hypothetical protein